MNLNRITDQCEVVKTPSSVKMQMPRLGAHYFEGCDEFQLEAFEDDRTGYLYLFFHDFDRAALTIAMHCRSSAGSAGDLRIDGEFYLNSVSTYEMTHGISLHRMQAMIWMLTMTLNTEKQVEAAA